MESSRQRSVVFTPNLLDNIIVKQDQKKLIKADSRNFRQSKDTSMRSSIETPKGNRSPVKIKDYSTAKRRMDKKQKSPFKELPLHLIQN